MVDIVKEVGEGTVTNSNNIFPTREPTDSLLSGNADYLDEIDNSLMIEADVKN